MIEFATNDGAAYSAEDWRSLAGVDSVHHENGIFILSAREPHQTIPALLQAVENRGLHLELLTTRQASLEDVFVHLTGRHLREE